MEFQDHFSRQLAMYLKARPTYPEDLFAYLAETSPSNGLCWDCATGNGQAAISLAQHFKKIVATDGSALQIQNAIAKENIEYRIGTAEDSGLENHSVDLISVATAAHWFNLGLFYWEAERVLKRNGVLAIWTYSEAKISAEIDNLMEWFMYDYLYDYWPDGRWYVRNKYEPLAFPFKAIQTPEFFCRLNWNREQWLDYIRSWSAYNNFVAKHPDDPIEQLLPRLNLLWNGSESKSIVWPLHLKCAFLNSAE